VVAGLTITASACFAHDLYATLRRGRHVSDREQVRVSRVAAIVIGVLAIGLGILANGQNTAFLVALAFAVAASANLPTILFTLFWKRFNTRGALWSMYGALSTTLVLITFSPAVSGMKTSMLPNVDFHWFPLSNPGIVSIPLGFLLGIVGTLTCRVPEDSGKASEMAVRVVTGIDLANVEHDTVTTATH
jgi:cation/acetate symporter